MNNYKKYEYTNITIKKIIGNRFRRFAKQIPCSNSEALEAMLNFFEWNELSPNDNLKNQNSEVKKRINAMIAILKNIEKHQTKPTVGMLQSLFQEVTTPTKPQFVEKKKYD